MREDKIKADRIKVPKIKPDRIADPRDRIRKQGRLPMPYEVTDPFRKRDDNSLPATPTIKKGGGDFPASGAESYTSKRKAKPRILLARLVL